MSTYRQVLGDVVHVITEHGSMSLRDLAAALDVPADEIRRQVEAYDIDVVSPSLAPRSPVSIHLEPVADDAAPSLDDLVSIDGDPARDLLGAERFDASVFGPLYAAAADLAVTEPDNEALGRACRKLIDHFLPGVKVRTLSEDRLVSRIRAAIDDRRRLHIVYSRAWTPGVTERVVDPYDLVRTRRGWEVDAGPPQPDGAIRTYVVGRISHMEVLDGTFERPADVLGLLADARAVTTVTGYVPRERLWAVRSAAQSVEVTDDSEGDVGVLFRADLRPPLARRAALMMINAGPDAYLDDPDLDEATVDLAGRLLEHHGLDTP